MSYSKRLRAYAPISLLLLTIVIDETRAATLEQRLLGASAPGGSDCKQTFESKAAKSEFLRPVNTFTTAFMIGPTEILGSTGPCRTNGTSSQKGYLTISLSYDNSVGYLPLTARIEIINAAQMTYGDAGVDPLLDSPYQKCTP